MRGAAGNARPFDRPTDTLHIASEHRLAELSRLEALQLATLSLLLAFTFPGTFCALEPTYLITYFGALFEPYPEEHLHG